MHQLKYLEICIFYCLWGSPLNFDKEKWHYIYIAQFLKKEFLIFWHNFLISVFILVIRILLLFKSKLLKL